MIGRRITLLGLALLLPSAGCSSGEESPTGRWMVATIGPSALQTEQFATGTYETSSR